MTKHSIAIFSLCLFLTQATVHAQKISRGRGVVLFLEGSHWEQKNFNKVLNNLNLPATSSFLFGGGVGTFWRFHNSEIGVEGQFGVGRRSGASDRITQALGLFNIGYKHHINFRTGSFYPLAGIGFNGIKTEITQRNGPTNITTALITRNTTTLFNRQGFAVLGLGVHLFESQRKAGFYVIETGYRLGFSATPWSTDQESGNYMTNSVTDELRQFYLKLGIGILRRR